MPKSNKSLLSLYLIGMVLVLVGCFLPLTASKFLGNGSTAFDALKDGSDTIRIGAILAFAGAIAGVLFCFVKVRGLPFKLISLLVSIAGGAYVWFNYMNASGFSKGLIKGALKVTGSKPGIGLIVIAAGWVIALLGYFQNKE